MYTRLITILEIYIEIESRKVHTLTAKKKMCKATLKVPAFCDCAE